MSEYNIQMNKYNALNAEYDQLYPQPMKHANTHAKDGSDPITPASIGAYTKGETDTLLQKKADTSSVYTKTETNTLLQIQADKSVAFTVTLTSAGWSNNAQTVSNANFLSAGYAYTVAPASGSFANYADAMVYADDVTTNGRMVFHCDSVPTANLTVNILRMVTTG